MGRLLLFASALFAVACAPALVRAEGAPPARASIDWDTDRASMTAKTEGYVITAPEDAVCTPAAEGAQRYSRKHKAILLCDGEHWKALQALAVEPER